MDFFEEKYSQEIESEVSKKDSEPPIKISDSLKSKLKNMGSKAENVYIKDKTTANAAILGALAGTIYAIASKKNIFKWALIGGVGAGFITGILTIKK